MISGCMDIHLPGKSGIETVKALKETRPDIQCMMFTVFEDEEKIYDALCAGATGYILKNTPSLKIIDAIRDLHAGGSPMSAIIARKVVQSFKPEPKKGAKIDILTTREVEILDYLSKGYRYKEIAGFLFISTETVRTHIRNIYQKLEVQSRTGALNKAYPKK
jgi:DNA-binding NarL/FixJ family response regulator